MEFLGTFDASTGVLPVPPTTLNSYYWLVNVAGVIDTVIYRVGDYILFKSLSQTYEQIPFPKFNQIDGVGDPALRWSTWEDVTDKPTNLVFYDANGDISARMIKLDYSTQSVLPEGSAMAFRADSQGDNALRFADREAVRQYLGRVRDSEKLNGKTLDTVLSEARSHVVFDSLTINGYSLGEPITLTAGDFGLGNVANYGSTSSPEGTSTTLYATQRAAYEAAAAPRLAAERKRYVAVRETAIGALDEDGLYYILDKQARTYTLNIKHNGIIYNEAP